MEEMRGELQGLSASLAASKGAKAKLETKVSQWETKLAEVREIGDEERIRMAEDTLRKAKASVVEKEKAIEALDRSVRRTELVLARAVDNVKEEEEEVVVEVDVEPEEMEERTVKVVVETPGGGGGVDPVAQGDDGVEGCRGHPGPAMGPGCPGWPPAPQTWAPPSSSPRRVRFGPVFVAAGAPMVVGGGGGGGGWVWVDEGGGGSTSTSPCA